jgi:hypothetical protein
MFIVTVDILSSLDLTSSVAIILWQTDGILVLVQDEGETTREI